MKSKQSQRAPSVASSLLYVLLIVILLVVALAIYVTRVLDPLHYAIDLLLLYGIYRIMRKLFYRYVSQKSVSLVSVKASRFTRTHKIVITLCIALGFLWYTVTSVVPSDRDVFTSLSQVKQTEIVEQDVEQAAVLLDMLILSGDKLLENPSLTKKELSQEEGAQLKRDWEDFILTSIETELMTDRHRYFQQISMFLNKDTHVQSFVIAYALYLKKFEIFHKIITKVGDNDVAIKIFNQHSERFGVGGMYNDVTSRFFASNSLLRRNLGFLYYLLRAPKDNDAISPNYASLLEVSRTSYRYIFTNALSHITNRSVLYKKSVDKAAFEAWLPIQKTVITDTIGNIHVGDRKDKFITVEQIEEMKKSMEPGDILLYRKNWYASNLGIPGFWTHASMYTGTLEDMDIFFKDVFPYQGYASMSDLLKAEYTKVYTVFSKKDERGYMPSVVESQTHGTLIQSIESSASVDYFGVVRSKLSKDELREVLLISFGHYGKSYDYAFDLDTKDEIYCSELVYDAYLKTSKSKGITFPKSMVSGRLMVPPSAIIEKFANEFGKPTSELDFVYFLDASEVTKKAFPSDVATFINTVSRPKYSSFQK